MITQSVAITCQECGLVYSLVNCKLDPTDEEDASNVVCPNGAHVLGVQRIIEYHGAVTLSYAFSVPATIETTYHVPLNL